MADDDRRDANGINDEAPPGADPYTAYDDFNLPAYVGLPSFQKLPWVTDADALARERPDVAIVGAPYDDSVSHRPGARFGPRAIRQASYHAGAINSLQLDIEPYDWLNIVDAGDAPVTPMDIERAHAVIERKVWDVARSGAIPIVLGGDHSITYPLGHGRGARGRTRAARDRPLRRACRCRQRDVGQPALARHADAPPHRVGRGLPGATSCRSACAATGPDPRRWSGCASRACAGT